MRTSFPPSLRVDVATGASTLDAVDVRVGGPIPFVLARQYRSRLAAPGPLGPGWRLGLDAWLDTAPDVWALRGGPFDGARFVPVAEGREAAQQGTGLVLQHHRDAVVVYASPRRQFVYGKPEAQGAALPLVYVRDAAGPTLALRRAGGVLYEVVDATGRALRLDASLGLVRAARLITPSGTETVATYDYTLGGELSAATDGSGRVTRYGYSEGLLVETADEGGGRQLAQYDAAGRCLALWWEGGGEAFALAYDGVRHATRVLDAAGGQTLYAHAMGRQVLERIAPTGDRHTYLYDVVGRLVGHVGEGEVGTSQHLADGQRVHVHAQSRIAFAEYGPDGLARSVSDGGEGAIRLGWDAQPALVSFAPAPHAAWTFDRDRLGRVVRVRSPSERVWDVGWDAGLAVSDAAGLRWREALDARGRPVSRTDRSGRQTTWTYGGERLEAVGVAQGGSRYDLQAQHDRAGRLLGLADSDRQSVRYGLDPAGALHEVVVNGVRVALQTDPLGRPTEARAPGRPPVLVRYSSSGRLVRLSHAEDVRTYRTVDNETTVARPTGTWTYSPVGDLLRVESETRCEAFVYGPSGLVLAWERPDGTTLVGYDAAGDVERLDDGDGPVRIERDADGLPVRLFAGEADDPVLSIHYDPLGRLARLVAPAAALDLHHDADDRVVQASGPAGAVRLAWDAIDRPTHGVAADGSPDTLAAGEWRATLLEAGPVQVEWVVTRGGAVVVAAVGRLALPLAHTADRRQPTASPAVWTLVATICGAAATVPPVRRLRRGMASVWMPDPDRDLRTDAAAVPRSRDLGGPTSALDTFALDATTLVAIAVPTVGGLAAHQDDPTRDLHDATTGPHRTGALTPAPWRTRALGRRLGGGDLLLRDGQLDVDALVDLALGGPG